MVQPTSDQHSAHPRRWKLGAALLGTALLAAGGSTFALTNPEQPAASASPELKIEHAPVDRGRSPAGSFAPIVQKVAPSVVEVSVTSKGAPSEMSEDPSDLFRRFFGQQGGRPGRGDRRDHGDNDDSSGPLQHGLGSGVIVSPDGYVLTNNHVIQGATDIRVALPDGRQLAAKVVGADAKTDVALIKIKGENLPALTFADSNEISVGDVVLAVGNPFGFGQTVTQGIISAKDRVNRVADRDMDVDFLQTDAAINPGNSGGALVDTEGRLVGINTSIFSQSGGNEGIGFAIPSNLCQWVMTSLVKNGHVERGFLGVSLQMLTPALAQEFKLDRINGALVAEVTPGSPAEAAGFKSGDVIREFNGQAVQNPGQLKLQVAESAPGSKANLKVLRDGETKSLDVTLKLAPDQKLARNNEGGSQGGHKDALSGVAVADLDHGVRSQMNIPDDVSGAIISEVRPNSPAAEAGLSEGDVITEINHHPIKNAQDAVKNTEKPEGNETLVKVWSRNGTHYLTVEENHEG